MVKCWFTLVSALIDQPHARHLWQQVSSCPHSNLLCSFRPHHTTRLTGLHALPPLHISTQHSVSSRPIPISSLPPTSPSYLLSIKSSCCVVISVWRSWSAWDALIDRAFSSKSFLCPSRSPTW